MHILLFTYCLDILLSKLQRISARHTPATVFTTQSFPLPRIVSIAVAGEDAVAAAVNSALVYFTLADITLLISMVAFIWVTKTVSTGHREVTGRTEVRGCHGTGQRSLRGGQRSYGRHGRRS